MARFGDKGPYAPWNVKIITVEENTREANLGRKHGSVARANMSTSHIGKDNHQLGRKHSLQSRKKISVALIGNENALGYKHTDEAKTKMRGRKFSPEHCMRLSQSHRGKEHSLETKIKMHSSRMRYLKHRRRCDEEKKETI